MPSEKIYKPAELARKLGVTSRTVRNACMAGNVPGAYLTKPDTGHWRIPESAARAYFEKLGREWNE